MAGYRIVALTVSTAMFMQFLDSTALNTAIPTIAHEMNVPAVDLNLTILSYQLAMTVLIPLGSAIAERIGQRNAFAFALLVFMVGSILCALSRSLPEMVAARALQGAGGAVMIPVSRLLVVRSADKSELMNAMNWLLLPGIVGPMLGPVVGGQIVTYGSWHWIFLINVPVALLGAALTFALIPDVRDSTHAPIDVRGIVLVGAAIFGLMFGLESAAGADFGWSTLVLLGGGSAFFLLFLRHARTSPAPVLDLTLLKIDSFRHSLVAGSIFRTIAGATGFIMPLWLQLGMGMSAAHAGVLLMASAIGAVTSRLVGERLTQWVHPRTIAVWGSAALVGMLLVNAQMAADWPSYGFYLVLSMQAMTVSVTMMVVGAVTYLDIEPARVGQAAGLFSTLQQLTLSLGVTLGVWAISGMRLFYGAGEHDGRIYSGSILMLAALAVFGLNAVRKLDAVSTGALQRSRR